MNPRTRRLALYATGLVAIVASGDALAHSYTGLYGWALEHRLGGWQALSWPLEIDVFLVVGELALYIAYLDAWPARQRMWPWATAVVGLAVSVAGNIGHVTATTGRAVTAADRVTAAVSPVAAFAGLMIGLLVLKMSRECATAGLVATDVVALRVAPQEPMDADMLDLVADAERIVREARAEGRAASQRMLAGQLRELGHRFSNAQLREIAKAAGGSQEAA